MTFLFLGLFVASSAGEILFNKEEADVLLHRPVTAKTLLRAKVSVLISVSWWLALAFNLVGFFIGVGVPNGGWGFPLAHLFSIAAEALFCTGTIVLVYQLCLRWSGRKRLESLMTTAQVVVTVGAMFAGQLLPQLMFRMDGGMLADHELSWWVAAMPPAWFAGIDDVLAGSRSGRSCLLAVAALAATAVVAWLAFDKFARLRKRPAIDWREGIAAARQAEPAADRPVDRADSAALVDARSGRAHVVSADRRIPGARPRHEVATLSVDRADARAAPDPVDARRRTGRGGRVYDRAVRSLYRHRALDGDDDVAILAGLAGGRYLSRTAVAGPGPISRAPARRSCGCLRSHYCWC